MAGIRIEATKKGKQGIVAVWTGDVAYQQVYHCPPMCVAGPLRIAAGDLRGGADEVTVMEMMIVQFVVASVTGGKADQGSPTGIVIEQSTVLLAALLIGGREPLLEPCPQCTHHPIGVS